MQRQGYDIIVVACEKSLGVAINIRDYGDSSYEVQQLTIGCKMNVVATVDATVAMHMVEHKF